MSNTLYFTGFSYKLYCNAEGGRPLFVSYSDYDPRGQCDFCKFSPQARGSGLELLYLKLAPQTASFLISTWLEN